MAWRERYVGAGQLVLQRRHGHVHGQRGTAQASHRLALPAKRRRGLFAHQHDQQRVVAAVLLKRVPGCMDQVVQRRIHMALAQLAGPLVQQTHAGDEFGARTGVAQRHVEQRSSGFPTGRARWRRPPSPRARALSGSRASAIAFSGALRRSITPMAAPSLRRHSRDSSSSANSTCERRCASCAALVMCAPAASSSRPLASRTPKGSVASRRRWSAEKGISFKQ